MARTLYAAMALLLAWWPVPTRAEPTARELRLMASLERDFEQGKSARALRRLGKALRSGKASAPELWLRYARLSVPCEGERLLSLPARDLRRVQGVWAAFPEQLARDAASAADNGEGDDYRRVFVHRGVLVALGGEGARALELVRPWVRREDAESVTCLRQLSAQAVAHDDLPTAEGALRLARGVLPQDHALPRELGLVLLARGDARGAVLQLEEAFDVDPQGFEVRRDLAYALAGAGRPQDGYTLLKAEGDRCRETARCTLELARLALEASSAPAAATYVEGLLKQEPKNLEAWLLLGEIHVRSGDAAAAKRAYGEVLRLSPQNPRAREALQTLSP